MDLVSDKGSINPNIGVELKFIFNDNTYKIASTHSELYGGVWNTIDRVIRIHDGKALEFTRKQLKDYFKNVIFIK